MLADVDFVNVTAYRGIDVVRSRHLFLGDILCTRRRLGPLLDMV